MLIIVNKFPYARDINSTNKPDMDVANNKFQYSKKMLLEPLNPPVDKLVDNLEDLKS